MLTKCVKKPHQKFNWKWMYKMDYLKGLVQEYNAIMAGAYPGDENKTLDKIEEICQSMGVNVDYAFELIEGAYDGP